MSSPSPHKLGPCLVWNSQPQFCADVAIPLFHSCIGFHEQRKKLRKVPLQQKGWKTLPYTFLSRQRYFRHPSQTFFEQRKDMTFDRRLANIRAPVVLDLYCPSSQSLIKMTLHEITVYNQDSLNPFSLILGSSVTPQRHIITSPGT